MYEKYSIINAEMLYVEMGDRLYHQQQMNHLLLSLELYICLVFLVP